MEYKCKAYSPSDPLKIFLAGQKYFGANVLRELLKNDSIKVVGVASPLNDKYLTPLAIINNIPIIEAGTLNYRNMPDNIDLGIAAHSFDYIGKKTRYKTKMGWIGFHPSLLPRHRGRSAIEWAIRMGDNITGASVFWLNSGIDRGDIFLQDWEFIPPEYRLNPQKGASLLWRETLLPMGVRLISDALNNIISGSYIKKKQDKRFSTFEPRLDKINDIFKPDLELLPASFSSNYREDYINGSGGIMERYFSEANKAI